MAGKLILHGITFALGKIVYYFNGEQIATVKAKEKISVDISTDGVITAKDAFGMSFAKELQVKNDMITYIGVYRGKFRNGIEIQREIPLNEAAEEKTAEEKPIYEMKGARGKYIRVYEDKCIIGNKASITTFIVGNGTDGEKTIYYQDVLGVQFKPCGVTIGYIQLETASSQMNNRNNNFWNENSFTFEKEVGKAMEIAEYLQKRVDECKKAKNTPTVVSQQLSTADELKKFKELLDMGVITQEEFDAKKKQLLGL